MLQTFIVLQLRNKANFADLLFPAKWGTSYCFRDKELLRQQLSRTLVWMTMLLNDCQGHLTLPQTALFLCGVVKDKVYERKPQTIEEMKQFIIEVFIDINLDSHLCQTVCWSVLKRNVVRVIENIWNTWKTEWVTLYN